MADPGKVYLVNGRKARVHNYGDPRADFYDPSGFYVAKWDELSWSWVINTTQRFTSRTEAESYLAALEQLTGAGLVQGQVS